MRRVLRNIRFVALVAVVAVVASLLAIGAGDLPGTATPLWRLLPSVAVIIVCRLTVRGAEQPVPLHSLVSPRAPPSNLA
jgi:hypothetical protein